MLDEAIGARSEASGQILDEAIGTRIEASGSMLGETTGAKKKDSDSEAPRVELENVTKTLTLQKELEESRKKIREIEETKN